MAEKPPLVSVVLPTYNRSATIERAVKSVLQQSWSDFELIVIDDGSSDDTADRLLPYRQSGALHYEWQENAGAAVARNQGVNMARGEFIAFQDSDDEWDENKLRDQVELMLNSAPDVAMIYSDMFRVESDGRESYLEAPEVSQGQLIDSRSMDYQVFGIGLVAALIRKRCIEAVDGFDVFMPRFIDLDLFVRLALEFRFVHLRKATVRYHQTEGITSNPMALARARERLLQKHAVIFAEVPQWRAKQMLEIADASWKGGDRATTLKWVRSYFSTGWWSGKALLRVFIITTLKPAWLCLIPRSLRERLRP